MLIPLVFGEGMLVGYREAVHHTNPEVRNLHKKDGQPYDKIYRDEKVYLFVKGAYYLFVNIS